MCRHDSHSTVCNGVIVFGEDNLGRQSVLWCTGMTVIALGV